MIPINDLQRHTAALEPGLSENVSRVLRSGRFLMGNEVEQFEREFAEYCGVGYAVGVANGTDAIEIGLRAIGVGPGSRVATVANAAYY
ncbi:MAG: DegT/DnrJ/EryC1/StrS family aminotransferase, partial [Bauldia sp.]|nr:DegT/DnrJ/EryC1/StrS family aminotransferase [Bauldia sp.]